MDEQLLKQDEEYIQKNADNEYEQNFENDELNMARYEDFGEDNGDLFDLDADVEEIIPEKETKPVKKKKSEKKQKKAAEPLDEVTLAYVSLDYAKQFVHTVDKSFAYKQYKSLSSSQKSKRIKESEKRKLRQRALQALERKEPEEEAWDQKLFNEKTRAFLSLTLDDFKIKNDEEFAAHIQENFDLYHQSLDIKNQLENVVSKKISVEPETRKQILTQVGLFEKVGDWMIKKREVMLDRYYPLLFSEDLKNYKTILAKLEEYRFGNKAFQNMFSPLRDFLRKVKAVDDCALNRKELTSSKAETKASQIQKLTELANTYAETEDQALSAKERAFEEKTTRETWIRSAKEAVKTKTEDPGLLREEKYDKQKFEQAVKEFKELDLSVLVFDSVENILSNVALHNELFRKGEIMSRLLAQAVMNGHAADTKDIDELRARIFVLNEFKTAQTKLLDVLCTDKVKELEKQPCLEWAKTNNVIKNTNAASRKEYFRSQYEAERSAVETRIRESWKALRPDGQVSDAEVDEAKKNYDKNLILWERIRYAREELKQEDLTNSLILRTLCEENKYANDAAGDSQFLFYLRGKSKDRIEALLKQYNGTAEEKLRLIKEIGDDTRNNLNEDAYEIRPDNESALLMNLNQKLSMADRFAVADQNIKYAEELISAEALKDAELPHELNLTTNWKKELMALKNFGVDHIKRRMDYLTNLTQDQNALLHLASFGINDLFRLKAQSKQLLGSLNNAGNSVGEVCARKIVAASDALVKNKLEIGEVTYGKKQQIASIQDALTPVYQSYRISLGLNGAGNDFSDADKQLYDQIDRIHADPAFSSREDLQSLRDLCVNVLSDYVQDIPEEEFYDLPTPVLKELAMNRLKYRERTTTAVIAAAIKEERDKGKRKEEDPVEPEWSVREKEALALISDLVDNKEAAENKEVRVANLRKILSAHAETLSDLARDKKTDPEKALAERKRYFELKELIKMAENIPVLAKDGGYESLAAQKAFYNEQGEIERERLSAALSKKELSEEDRNKEIDRQIKALDVLKANDVAGAAEQIERYKKLVEDRLTKEGKSLEELKKELNDLVQNSTVIREIERDQDDCDRMETEQLQLQFKRQNIEKNTSQLLKQIDSEEASIRKLEKTKEELLNKMDPNAVKLLEQADTLQEDLEWYTLRLRKDQDLFVLSAEQRNEYESKKKEVEAELDALKKTEAYQKAEAGKTGDYSRLEKELSGIRKTNLLSQAKWEKEQAGRKKVEEALKRNAEAMTELLAVLEKKKNDYTPNTTNILSSMSKRLAVDSPEKRMVKAVDEALAKITDYLMVKTGDKAFKLKDIRLLIENTEDDALSRLLETADQKIEETIKGTYDDIANIVQTSAEFIFETIRDDSFDKLREHNYDFTHHGPVEAFQQAVYTDEDKEADRKKEETFKKEEQTLKAELQKERDELEKKRVELDIKLNEARPEEERILLQKSSRQLELERILPDYSAMDELLSLRVQWTNWNTERDALAEKRKEANKKNKEAWEKERKKNKENKDKAKDKDDEVYVPLPKSEREQELDKLLEKKPERMQLLERIAKPVEDSDAEGFYMRYAKDAFRDLFDKRSLSQKTLEDYYGDAWAPDEREVKREGSLKTGAGEGVFVKNVMQNYFSRVNEKSKRSMMTSLFRNLKPELLRNQKTGLKDLHERTNSVRHAGMYLGGLLRGAGPLVQKLMQGVPEDYLSLEMKNAVEDVKSRLSPIPDAYIKQKFEEMKRKSEGKVTDIKKIRSLGAASVGQALLCELTMADGKTKQVVIKILRPGVNDRVAEDASVILKCAEETSEGMKKTYEGQLKKIEEELDLRIEAKNCRDAVKAYKDGSGMTATVSVMEEIPAEKDYLLLDKADGITVDRFVSGLKKDLDKLNENFYYWVPIAFTDKKEKKDLFKVTRQNAGMIKTARLKYIEMLNTIMKRQKNIQKMTELWIEQSLFSDGFYHGDMHAGNIMISNEKATFLDYGNATKLKADEVKHICGMNAAAMFKDARVFLDRFLMLIPEEQLKALNGDSIDNEDEALAQRKKFAEMKNQIRLDLYEIFKLGKIENAGDRVFLALQAIQKYGIEIPIPIYSYCQSQLRLSNTLDELNRLEDTIRFRIAELDRASVEFDETYGDILLKACREGNRSADPEKFYKGLNSVVQELDEKAFLEEINNFDEKAMEEFKDKYLSIPTVIDDLLEGKHVIKGDYDDEDVVADKVVIDTDKWESEYRLWQEELKTAKTQEERDALYSKEGSRGYKLNQAIYDSVSYGAYSNGLMDSFGGTIKVSTALYNAIREGDEGAFHSLMDFFKTYIKAASEAMKKYKLFVEKYAPKSGFFGFFSFKAVETPEKKKEREQEALAILKELRTVREGAVESHGTIFEIGRDLNFDRLMEEEAVSANDAYEYSDYNKSDSRMYKVDTIDYTQLDTIKNEWKTLHDKENRSPEEEEKYKAVGHNLVKCYNVFLHTGQLRRVVQKNFEQNLQTYYMMPGGDKLKEAYDSYSKIRDRDIEAKLKRWDDDSLWEERKKASKEFMSLYLKVAAGRIREHTEAYQEKIPAKVMVKIFDENLDEKDSVVNYGCVLNRVLNKGFGIGELTGNKMKLANAIGFEKAKSYFDGSFKPGLDLVENVEDLKKPVRK